MKECKHRWVPSIDPEYKEWDFCSKCDGQRLTPKLEIESTIKTTTDDLVIPLPSPPTHTIQILTEFLAKVVHDEVGTKNGQTALYWNLLDVIGNHVKGKTDEIIK